MEEAESTGFESRALGKGDPSKNTEVVASNLVDRARTPRQPVNRMNKACRFKTVLSAAALLAAGVSSVSACEPRDFNHISLSRSPGDAAIDSVLIAYPGTAVGPDGDKLVHSSGRTVTIGGPSKRQGLQALADPTFADQFRYLYPLVLDGQHRLQPWFDPGRLRNAAFMAFLYFDEEATARESLVTVSHEPSGASFRVTTRQGVACQLKAALDAIGADGSGAFDGVGGGFAWRQIAGTARLSAHSFGAAIDLNSQMGGYWRWSGRKAGDAGPYRNPFRPELIEAFERFGFIWGGKWHHFDGMHFEYRPELIIYARLTERTVE